MTARLGFHIPVNNPYPSSLWERLEERADHYLSLTRTIATVTSPHPLSGATPVSVHNQPSTYSQYALTFFKVVSYATVILPVVALLLKVHRKYHHDYVIQNQSPHLVPVPHPVPVPFTPPADPTIVIDDDTPDASASATQMTPKQDLLKKGFLDHSTIAHVLAQHRDLLQAKKNPYFFIERKSVENDSALPFQLTIRKQTPDAMKGPYPQTGGLALSMHSEKRKHFTGLFVDFAQHTIVYYDPLGTPMDPTTATLVQKVKTAVFDPASQASITTIDLRAQHQFDGYNCGRYVIRFLTSMMSHDQPLETRIKNMKTSICAEATILDHAKTWVTTYSLS